MKKSLVIVGALILAIVLAGFALPIIFKDQIKKAVDEAIAESVRAKVSYDDFSLSFFKGFPNLSMFVNGLSVVGAEQFEGDTLIVARQITVRVNPLKALFSERLEIKSIELSQPKLLIKVMEDGSPNYDIAVQTSSEPGEPSTYDLGIKKWKADNGSIVYDDRQTGFYLALKEVNHEGSGDFTQDLFDLTTSSVGQLTSMQYQGVEYISNKQLTADLIMEMDLPQARYTFKENQVSINEFAFAFDGWMAMPEDSDDMLMDLTFETRQNEFQHLLSCVPGMYREGFENIETQGLVTMSGMVNGTYNQTRVPAFQLSLKVNDGMFQYPDLPTAVSNINLDLLIENKDGVFENTLLEISKLHLEFGPNPLDGMLRVDGLATPEIKAELQTALNLAELSSMFPMEGTTVKGDYELRLNADGIYDSTAQLFPKVNADMKLTNGFIKSEAFPETMEQFNLTSTVSNQTGRIPDTRIEVPDFSFVMDGEKFLGRLTLTNPNDYTWDVDIDGGVDLEKMAHLLALEDMTLKGLVRGKLSSKGKLSSLEAERYNEIPTSGAFTVENFFYDDKDLAHPFEIRSGGTSFTPHQITLTNIQAAAGDTDLNINGAITNYINYVFEEGAPISGVLVVNSNSIDLNQWMTDSAETGESEALTVLEIPTNVDFDIQSKAGVVYYDNMTLEDVRGRLLVKEGIVTMQDLSFKSLGGNFSLAGTYDPRDLQHPKFDFGIDMQQVDFMEAFNTFNTVKILAPVAQFANGKFSANFKLSGELQQDMMPALNTLTGKGLVNIITATLSGSESKLVRGFTEITRFSDTPSEFKLKDVIMIISIENGRMNVAPFDAAFGDYKTSVSGSTGIDGSVDFLLNMEVPAGVVGSSVNQAIAKLTGSTKEVDDKVNLNLKLSGSYLEPKFAVGGIQGENTTAGLAKSAVQQKKQETEDSAKALFRNESQKLAEKAQQRLDSLMAGSAKDSTKTDSLNNAAKELLKEDRVDDVFNLFKKKKKPADSVQEK